MFMSLHTGPELPGPSCERLPRDFTQATEATEKKKPGNAERFRTPFEKELELKCLLSMETEAFLKNAHSCIPIPQREES